MKTATILLTLTLVSISNQIDIPEELREIVEETHNQCKKETGVSTDILEKAMKGDLAEDPKFKCFLKCMLQGLQAMRDDGSMDLDLIEATLPPEVKEMGAMDTLKKCLPKGSDLCQASFDMVVCMAKTNPELSKLFE